jgi:class 3 adenylate cyclase/pimeloyl-ACP methyl ester carboxylesterase
VTVLVCKPPGIPVDLMWEEPSLARFVTGLASFSRCIWFDPLGIGSSDALAEIENRLVEAVVEDMVSLLDALGSERAVVLGLGSAFASILFAATFPDRAQALVLHNPGARIRRGPDYPQGLPDEILDGWIERVRLLDEGTNLFGLSPALAKNERFVRWYQRCERLASTPTHRVWRMRAAFAVDVRSVLPTIRVPTLVCLQGPPVGGMSPPGEYVADHIDGARLVRLSGEDGVFFAGDCGPFLDAIEEFVTGELPAHSSDRVLATVMFTDLVDSTAREATMGDQRWRELVVTHDGIIRDEVDRFRGRTVKFTGDGVLATFDGPARGIRCAVAIRDRIQALGLDMRAGLHTGEIDLLDYDVSGIAVNIGQRVASVARPGEVLVSRTVADLLAGSNIPFADRGEHQLKGVPGTWRLFSVVD